MSRDTSPPMEPAEFGRLIETFLDQATAYAHSILRNRHQAEDAVQQAALKGLQRLPSFDTGRSFKSWWLAIVRNCCIDLLRCRRPAVAIDLVAPAAPAPHAPDDWEQLSLALDAIAPEHAEILRGRYFANLTYRELSELLAIPEGTVMSRLHYARKALAAEIERIDR